MTTADQPQPDPNDFDGSEAFSGRDGRIITFYSYKGGTGRSMALANAAFVLGMHGKRVLVIDWDLEAPGLHRYFHPFLEDPQIEDSDGLLEFVGRLAATAAREPLDTVWADKPDSYFAQYADILSFSQPVRFPDFPPGGALDFIPAGRQDRTYSERLSLFRFIDFYEKLGGRRFLEAAKQTVRDEYDYILIDSRTGVSDSSGICTVQMPDTLVLCFTLNEQNILGAADIARRVRAQRETEKRDREFRIFPVPCRVELSEQDRRMVLLDRVKRLFNTYLADLKPTEKVDYWGRAQIVYIPYYAFEEIPALFGNPPRENISMLTSAVQIVSLVCGLQGEPASLIDDRRKEFLRSFLYSPDDPLTLARGILDEYPQRDAVKSLLLRFVAPGSGTLPDSTRPVALGDVKPEEEKIMERLRDAGLLVQDDSASPPVLRLVREDLIRSWGVLAAWIASERDFFEWRSSVESALAAWRDRKKNASFLLRDSQLLAALEWRDRRSGDLQQEILEYISISEESDPLRAGERICQTAGLVSTRRYFLRFVDAHGSPRFVGASEIAQEDRVAHELALRAHLVRPVESGPVSKITGESGYQLTDDVLPWNWTEYRRWIDLDERFLAARDEISALARNWINQGKEPALLTRGRQLDTFLQSLAGRENELTAAAAEFLNACDQNDPVRRAQKGYVEAGAEATAWVLLRFVRTPRNSSMPSVVTYPRNGFSQEDLDGPVALFQRLGIIAESDPLALTEPSLITEWSWLAGRIESDRAALEQITGLEDLASGWDAEGRPKSLLLPADQLEKRGSATLKPRLSPVAREFIVARMVQRQRFRRLAGSAIAAVLAVAIFLGLYYFRRPKGVDLLRMAATETSSDLRSLLIAEWSERQPAAASPLVVNAALSSALGIIPVPIFIPSANAPADLKQVQFDPAGHLIGAASSTCTVYQPNGTKLRQEQVGSAVMAVAPDGTLAITKPGGGVSVLRSGGTLPGNVDTIEVSALAFAASNILVKGDSGGLSTWDLPLFRRSDVFFTPRPRMVRCDDRGILCGVVSSDSSARLWNVQTHQRNQPLTHEGRVQSLDFAPGSNPSMVVTASEDSTARIWTLTSDRPTFISLQHAAPVRDAHFRQSRVITASDDKTAKIWDAKTGVLQTTLAMEDPVLTANFSPNGQTVATASGRWLRLWTVGAKAQTILEYGFNGSVLGLSFSADGEYLAAAGEGGEIQVWNLQTSGATGQYANASTLSSQLCSEAKRNLTPAEWLKLFPKEPYRRTCSSLPIPDTK